MSARRIRRDRERNNERAERRMSARSKATAVGAGVGAVVLFAPALAQADTLRDILAHCDRAKFGGRLLSGAQIDALHMRAWQFVHRTRIPGAGRNGRNR